ncbi:MAG: ATP-binding protein [Candidatus Woesearchaeota archaeon]
MSASPIQVNFASSIKGVIVGGSFDELIARKHPAHDVALGELLVAEAGNQQYVLQVYHLSYASQRTQAQREELSSRLMQTEQLLAVDTNDEHNYQLLHLKNLLSLKPFPSRAKTMPPLFSPLRAITPQDLPFLATTKGLYLGNLRATSHDFLFPIYLDPLKTISHHLLIAATTGRGKSNLTALILSSCLESPAIGCLVLDPHDEYYGRNGIGLKDHPKKEHVVYYTAHHPPLGQHTLKINCSWLKPYHFQGVVEWTDAQQDLLYAYFREKGKRWIEALLKEEPIALTASFQESTKAVVKRKLTQLLEIQSAGNHFVGEGIFTLTGSEHTVPDIVHALAKGNVVIIDTSTLSSQSELLVGSLLAHLLFHEHKKRKKESMLSSHPVVCIVLEEAPRVLGKDALEKGNNIFATIAREGRKFNVGLCAITQLPSLIPREILANLNTKIILGIEMQPERDAIITAAAQDLRSYSQAIASLNTGEALISSTFLMFPIPLHIPYFPEVLERLNNEEQEKKGIKNPPYQLGIELQD